jgi:hypothetical protein
MIAGPLIESIATPVDPSRQSKGALLDPFGNVFISEQEITSPLRLGDGVAHPLKSRTIGRTITNFFIENPHRFLITI